MNLRKQYWLLLAALFCLPFSASFAQDKEPEVAEETATDESSESKSDEGEDENPGQAKLDEATDLKITARNPADLAKVIKACEEAIKLGLDEGNTQLANKVLAGTALQRAKILLQGMPRVLSNPRALRGLRDEVLKDLNRATKADAKLAEAYVLGAQLEMLPPPANRKKALEKINKGVELLEDDKLKSSALLLRATLRNNDKERLEDLDAAIESNSENVQAWQAKLAVLQAGGRFEEMLEGAEKLLDQDSENAFALQAVIQALMNLEKSEAIIDLMSERIEEKPDNNAFYRIRAQAYIMAEESEKAIEDLNKALEINDSDHQSLVMRGQIYFDDGEIEKANRDISDALLIEPNSLRGVVMRSLVAAREERYGDAISDMELLVRNQPNNPGWVMQLASYYQMDDRPRKAIALLSELVKRDPKNTQAIRLRGDARLAISEHKEAVADYEQAIKVMEESAGDSAVDDRDYSGALNNLAWVLATSSKDEIRDGKKSVEYGLKACELTEYKEAHILSTLAAGYAETGDFENARKWAAKAVEVGEAETPPNPQVDQLKEELESYKKDKPWREDQETPENEKPLTNEDTIDT